MKATTPRYVRDLAKEMRKEPTPAETLLWEHLRRKNLQGYKFYRSYPIGRYIADFCCPERKLIVELDGGIHETERNIAYDMIRDKTLYCEGMLVIRFKNEAVISDIDSVLDNIASVLSSNFPLPQDGGGVGERVDGRI
jgi:5-methyltetrahydrofolate--homocysteine methyltransferase